MKAIVNTAPGKLELQDWPVPEPGPGQVRIRTGAVGICATDLEMIAGWQRTACPAIPGHEWAGTVEALGAGVDRALLGRRCVAENVLADGGEVGFEHPGGYGQFLITEARNVQRLPEDFPFAVAALIEPLAVGIRALRRLQLRDKRSVLICGDGPIGLLLLMLLKQAGVEKIVLVGGRTRRLALARELGAAQILNRHELHGDLPAAVKAAAGGPFPNVIEASGSGAGIAASLALVEREGKILVVGDYAQARADFPWNLLLHREIELVGSNASANAWPEAVRLATQKQLPLHLLLTHQLPAARFAEGLDLVRGKRPDVIKVVLEWE